MWLVLAHYVKIANTKCLQQAWDTMLEIAFRNCAHGGERPKNTTLRSTSRAFLPLALPCPGNHYHKPYLLTEVATKWFFDTAAESEYPALLCLRFSKLLKTFLAEPRPSALCVPCRTSTAIVCALCSLPDLNRERLRSVFPAGPQPRPSALSVPCRTSTATVWAQCSLPDLDQPRPSALSVPCRASTATVCAQCSLPDLNRDRLRSVFPAGPQPRRSALSVPCRTSTAR